MNSTQISDGADAGENTATTPSVSTPERVGAPRARSSRSSDANVPTGSVLRMRYVLEELVGRGGSSLVFRASDLHRTLPLETRPYFVAVKVLQAQFRNDPQAVLRLRREFRQTQLLSHPRVVRVFDLDCDDDIWFMTMELLAGQNAQTWMQTPRDLNSALKVIDACCEALEHAHAQGIVHGDIKPTNVVVGDDGNVKLIDFGSSTTAEGRVGLPPGPAAATTALYASPQVLAGKRAEISDDIFSLACLSYGLLSGGRHPFGRRPSLEDGRAKLAPTYVNSIPRELFEIIERGLAVEPPSRPASASEFRGGLSEAAQCLAARAARAVPLEPAPRDVVANSAPRAFLAVQDGPPATPRHGNRVLDLDIVVPRAVRRRAMSLANVFMLTLLTLGAVMLLRIGTHRPVMQVAMTADAPAVDPPTGAAVAPQVAAAPIASGTPSSVQSVPTSETATPTADNGVISFETPSIHASPTQPLVAVSVRRLRSTRSVGAFIWRVEGGSAHPGTDFGPTRPELVRFNRGESVRTLFIPLVAGRARSLPAHARTFSVILEPVVGGPELGHIRRAMITIDPAPDSLPSAAYQVRALDPRGAASPQSNE